MEILILTLAILIESVVFVVLCLCTIFNTIVKAFKTNNDLDDESEE